MNVYDFDGTIYEGDSTVDFYMYSLWVKPSLIRYLPKQVAGLLLYNLHIITKTQFKEYFFCFLRGFDRRSVVLDFWDKRRGKIGMWYLSKQKPNDVIISASPEFLLKPICEQLGIRILIASKVSPKTGEFTGKNCYGGGKGKAIL